ncbi:coenzyme F420-0:L-glutamate ligase [Azospirillum sp. TSO5]|uniref:coenzyme F420-0:L-glutamate ligase n=1 Tax=Azospirillum sp. TSO5 TaxID=716760 RepID=UPI000D61B132|nr:coenzyme F420-0:L-glutamate ligase [Azospirillum sp. TSO5]PWC94112.1 F420-0--gamma-glutamyl ligase [Azospirillum sp. TSO5]
MSGRLDDAGHGTGSARLELLAPGNVPLVAPGDDLARLIVDAFAAEAVELRTGDVLVLAQKIVSKAQGRYAALEEVEPSARAVELARTAGKDPRIVELVLRESREVLRCVPGVIVVETRHGVVLANAGIDRSNVDQSGSGERVLLLPEDPDGTCRDLRRRLADLTGADVGVIINDSLGRAWRNGTVGTALGVSGLPALEDLRGSPDLFGYDLRATDVAAADEIAAAASLLMGQSNEGRPVVLVRGLRHPRGDGAGSDLLRPREKDLFR